MAYLVAKEKLSPKVIPVINIFLILASVYLGYKIYDSITAPVRFNKIKKERYAKVIRRLKDIRDSEVAMRTITGDYTASFDSLIQFVDTAKFPIIQQRDSVIKKFDRFRGIETEEEIIIIDTLGFVPVKDSLFKNDDRYKEMMWVPIPGREKQVKFELRKGYIKKGDVKLPVFEARVAKREILWDQPEDLVAQEENVISTEEINGPYIIVGSLEEVTTSGNWPKVYDIEAE
ncbi:MAG: hypothetical protein GXO27_03130 [Chlorobi bacterium]|nr:hypothetical protein [Chlorobiota bacterium]